MSQFVARLMAGATVALAANTSPLAAQEIVLDGIVVTSSKTSESAIDALSASSAIGKETLDQQFQASRVSDVLRTMPGVTTQDNGRDTAQAVNIRGLQDFGRVNVLVEGARQNFQRSGHAANGAFYLDPEMVKAVEVTRGPSATIYGSGAVGGVVAFELLDADDILRDGERAAVQGKTRYDTNGNGKMGSATAAMKLGNFDIVAQKTGHENDNYEDGDGNEVLDSDTTTRSQFSKLRWRPAAGHEITASVVDLKSKFVDRTDPSNGSALIQRDSDLENRQYTIGYTYKSQDTELIDFSAKVYRNDTDLDQVRRSNKAPRYFYSETEGFDVFNTSRFSFGAAKLALTYGGDAFKDSVNTKDLTSNGDEFTPSGERTASGAFAQSQITIGMFEVLGALRYDRYELTGTNLSSSGDHISPKVTLGVTPISGITLFGTYAEGYRAPALSEVLPSGVHPGFPFVILPNTALTPEVAHNFEAGVNIKQNGIVTSGDAFRAKFVGFQNKVDDYIGVADKTNPGCFAPPFPSCGTYQYVNIGQATLEGVEAEINYDARSWFANINASRIRGTNDNTGEALLSVPADQVVTTLGIRALNEKLVAGARARFVAAQDRVPASSLTLATEGYAVFDLFAEYEVTEMAKLNLNIDNLFDADYRQYRNLQDDPGFNARLGLTVRLGAK